MDNGYFKSRPLKLLKAFETFKGNNINVEGYTTDINGYNKSQRYRCSFFVTGI